MIETLIQKGTINSEQLKALLEENKDTYVLIDVREESEYNMSHIKGVDMLKPLSMMSEWLDTLIEETKEKVVIFTCHTGARSGDVQKQFRKKGHLQVLNHIGGIASYRGEIKK